MLSYVISTAIAGVVCGFGAIAIHTDTRVAQQKKINLINYPQKYLCAGWFGGSIETV